MAKFITLTEAGPQHRRVAINVNTIEYMLERVNCTELVTSTNHTKYVVQESMNDILNILYYYGLLVIDHSNRTTTTEEAT